jgi:arylsulfatase A-like enzyme
MWRIVTSFLFALTVWANQSPAITIAIDANQTVAVAWNGAGVLAESSDLDTWGPLPWAVDASSFTLTGDAGFWRVQWPTFPVVDTNQNTAFDVDSELLEPPEEGEPFHGQDATYTGAQPFFSDNGDGTVTDHVTGLMWQQDPGAKMTWNAGVAGAGTLDLGDYNDWRLPTIKELYSLMDFRGVDPSGYTGTDTSGLTPFIDTGYFIFEYGDVSGGERVIDAQYWSSTEYVSTTMNGDPTVFGVNFADGRIKGYPKVPPSGVETTAFVRYVRGNPNYGINDFFDNGDGTVTDLATGLMWLQDDSGAFNAGPRSDGSLNWEEALAWAEGLEYAGYDDWRLPNAKELQGILDYTRSPDTTNSPAIDPVFNSTLITNEAGGDDYPHYWASTTHISLQGTRFDEGVYFCFGEGLGWMNLGGNYQLLDVHGAGCQRSDPKDGDPADFPNGRGPQGDVIRIFNFVRPVRGGLILDEVILPGAPEVLQADQSATLNIGDSITLIASATGEEPLSYQWLLDGVDVTGANDASLEITSFGETDAGVWSVRVSNAFGSDFVDVATLNAFSQSNILLLILDDWGTDASPMDNPTGDVASLPTIESLAANGIRFTQAYAQPLCSPTRASLLTGRQPFQHRVGNPSTDSVLPSDEETLPEILAAKGAPHAMASFGKWHLGSGSTGPADTGGWQKFAGILSGGVGAYDLWTKVEDGVSISNYTTYTTTDQVNEAVEWIGSQGANPWFVWMGFKAPHSPFHDPGSIDPDLVPPGGYSVPDTDTSNSANYIRMLETLDYEIERLLASVDLDNTHVILIGDNGTPGQTVQAPYSRGHAKGSLYQGGIHVPMVVSGPAVSVPLGSTSDVFVHATDLFATILELTGLDPVKTPAKEVLSQSIVPVLHGTDTASRRMIAELFSQDDLSAGRAIISGEHPDYKLIIFGDPNSSVDVPVFEFYNISDDENEQSPLDVNALSASAQAAYEACLAIDAELGGGYSDPATGVEEIVHIDLPANAPPLINSNNGNIVSPISITIGGANANWDTGTITVNDVTTSAARVDEDGNPDQFSVVATFDAVASGLPAGSYDIIVTFPPASNPRAFTATNQFVIE